MKALILAMLLSDLILAGSVFARYQSEDAVPVIPSGEGIDAQGWMKMPVDGSAAPNLRALADQALANFANQYYGGDLSKVRQHYSVSLKLEQKRDCTQPSEVAIDENHQSQSNQQTGGVGDSQSSSLDFSSSGTGTADLGGGQGVGFSYSASSSQSHSEEHRTTSTTTTTNQGSTSTLELRCLKEEAFARLYYLLTPQGAN